MKYVVALLVAGVVLTIAWMGIEAYGKARYDAGYAEAADVQKKAADDEKSKADREKEAARRRMEILQAALSDSMDANRKLKEEALLKDEEYRHWRETRVHPVARCRIWRMCDPPAVGNDKLQPTR